MKLYFGRFNGPGEVVFQGGSVRRDVRALYGVSFGGMFIGIMRVGGSRVVVHDRG